MGNGISGGHNRQCVYSLEDDSWFSSEFTSGGRGVTCVAFTTFLFLQSQNTIQRSNKPCLDSHFHKYYSFMMIKILYRDEISITWSEILKKGMKKERKKKKEGRNSSTRKW